MPTVRPHPIQAHQARFAWWLAVAVFLHALLLLIPARQDRLPGPRLTTLTVAFPGAGVQPGDTRALVTTARLLDFAHHREWTLPEPSDPPRLGVLTPQPPPPNWRAGTPAEDTALPAKTGIVDQWLAADGSRNLMIRTPTGQLLCGRAEAWNPMYPLVEPVMMYRACGGGRPSFEMPSRPGRVLLR